MTSKEIERTLDFILQHQAQAAIHFERLAERQGEMQSLLAQITELAQVQSRRLDRHDETFQSIHKTFQSMQSWQRDALTRLDQILDRLSRDR